MKGKLIPICLVFILLLGSFGAIGSDNVNDECRCNKSNSNLGATCSLTGTRAPQNWQKDANFDPCEPLLGLPAEFDWRDPALEG